MITSLSLHRVSTLGWRAEFESDLASPLYRVWIDGERVGETPLGWWEFTVVPGDSASLEVYDAAEDEPAVAHPARVVLQWRGLGSAVSGYRVEEWVGGTWLVRGVVPERGLGYCHWRSRRLADDTEHTWRVVAVGTGGAETVATVSALMVRRPDPPDLLVTYNEETGTLLVA